MAINLNGTGSITGLTSISSPGISGVPVGSASAPSFSFTGDSNTGIYSPGADQVAISTNGTGRLFVDASGNVGLGISPTTRFHVYQAGSTQAGLIETNQSASVLNFKSTGQSSGQPQVGCAGSDMILNTNGSERLRITSDGKVGLGTSTADYALDVRGTNPRIQIKQSSASDLSLFQTVDNAGNAFFIGADNSTGSNFALGNYARLIYSQGTAPLRISTNGTHAVTIDSSQRVGVGSTSPATQFSVQNASTSLGIEVDTTSGFASGPTIRGYYRAGSAYNTLALTGSQVVFGINDVERARLDASGRLLVGTSTARTNLFGIGVSSLAQFENSSPVVSVIRNDNSAAGPYLILGKSRSTSNTIVQNGDVLGVQSFHGNDGTNFIEGAYIAAWVDGTPGTNDMPSRLTFATCPDGSNTAMERMRISANGNISIGLGTDLTRLYVRAAGNTSSTYNAYITNTDNSYLFVVRDDGLFYTGLAASSPYNNTTSTAANLVVDGAGVLYRSTSSARFKTDIETLEDSYADNILNCRPVWYRSTANADDPSWGWWGFIAEEVAEVDPRLVFWKTKETKLRDDYVEEEGKAPGPADYVEVELDTPIAEGVQYDRFVPHLVNLIKRQQQAIEDLQAEVAALKAQ